MDRAENFLTKRLIIVRIKAQKQILDFRKKKIRIFSKILKSRCSATVASIATLLKSIQLDPGMNLPVKFHQNRLTPLASRAVHYIQTNRQTYRQTENLRLRVV